MFSVALVLAAAAAAIIGIAAAIVFAVRKDRAVRARGLTIIGAAVMGVFAVLGGLFIGGEAMLEPGGTAGILLIAAWLVPLLILVTLAWFAAPYTVSLLIGLVAVVVIWSIAFAVDPEFWGAIENQYGPIRAIAVFVVGVALATLGLKRTMLAGWLLVALGVIPLVVSLISSRAGGASLAAACVIPIVVGVTYLIAAGMTRRTRAPETVAAGSAPTASAPEPAAPAPPPSAAPPTPGQ